MKSLVKGCTLGKGSLGSEPTHHLPLTPAASLEVMLLNVTLSYPQALEDVSSA